MMKKAILISMFMIWFLNGCEEEITPKEVIEMRLSNSSNSIPADNTSTLEFIAYISENADLDKRSIEFETTAGVFSKNSENTITVVAEDTLEIGNKNFLSASVKLKSSNIVTEQVTVTAKIAFYPARKVVSFTPSAPISIALSADKFGLTNSFDSETTITALVKSETGFPSSGERVEFLVFNSEDNFQFTDLRFRDEKLSVNASGLASAMFTAGNLSLDGASPFVGDLTIVSRIVGQETISDTLKLNVTDKTD